LRQSAVTSEGERLVEGRYYRGLESAIAMASAAGTNGRRNDCIGRPRGDAPMHSTSLVGESLRSTRR